MKIKIIYMRNKNKRILLFIHIKQHIKFKK